MNPQLVALELQGRGLVTLEAARRAGISRSCIRWAVDRGELVRLAVGVWCSRRVWDRLSATGRHRFAVRAHQHRRRGVVACAESAALIHRLPLPGDPPAEPRLLVARTAEQRGGDGRKGGARGRRAWLLPDEVVTTPDGIRVTMPARTVVDLARHVSFPWALAAADCALRRRIATRAQLEAAAARNPTAPGHPAAVLVARHASDKPESALESVNRGVMIELGLPVPEPQVVLGDQMRSYRVDLLVAECWTVVESDGKVKYDDATATVDPAERVWLDKRRRDYLHDWGYEVVRFVMADQRDPTAWGRRCVRSFDRAHEQRGLPTPDWGSRLAWL